jgi:hypothetical protein
MRGDPSILQSIKPENRFKDYGSDGVGQTFDPNGTEGKGIWDMGEEAVSLAERESYGIKRPAPKLNISRGWESHFPSRSGRDPLLLYGHFFQVPRFELLYSESGFENLGTARATSASSAMPTWSPEQTISGESACQQQLSDDIAMGLTGYFRVYPQSGQHARR